jgi:hypothetical protein
MIKPDETVMKLQRLILCALISFLLSTSLFAADSKNTLPDTPTVNLEAVDFNDKIYYKNKLELSFDTGWLPYNIPFIFNPLMGEKWSRVPLDYTLVPLILSLRWQLYNVNGPLFLRGNCDLTFSGSYTIIPQGPESRYAAYMMGIRYNFVQRNWRVAPYIEGRAGVGFVDAKGPEGVKYAQGQDLTFNFNLGIGVRYNFSPRYSMSVGIGYMHISNLYLSEPKTYNYGINVVGPTLGFNYAF